ncbi:hypothetical protein [Plantactinospora sp. KBS50]|uniref:WXG100-like domain-containing protein n=1 Tax=Plantactinospora sp. KBS50 TaxID=2024580 RepID=UPI000BAB132A|nr:hypothetical protein [Plantactinospora sp. KBS50]ASW57122.1 hypothetical protein CIK06_27725 [Plantactinospora sp. KBS50]
MSEEYYGFQPVSLPGYAGAADTYVPYDPSDPNNDLNPTDWGATNIEKMWAMIQKESDERAFALSEMWRRTARLLESTRDNILRHGDALNAKWTSPAGEIFMGKIGATLYSLDEWKKIAHDNATGLEQLGNKIQKAQQDFKPLWEEYEAALKKNDGKEEFDWYDPTDWFGDTKENPDDIRKRFHGRAVDIMKPLADTYVDVYLQQVSKGSKFKGPTNAPIVDPNDVPHPGAPTPPGGRPPGSPSGTAGAPPARPDVPTRPGAAATVPHDPPPTDPGLDLAGGVAAPPAPPPAAPSVPTPPPAPAAPGAPPAPLPPGLGGPNANAAGRPTLPGGRGAAPGRPNLPTGEGPGGRGPGRPTLPGSTARNGGGRPGRPGAAAEPPPGGRGRTPGRPTLPGSKGGPGTPRSGAPGTRMPGRGGGPASPKLSGKTGRPGLPGEATEGTGRGARPSLGGKRGAARPGAPAEPETTGRPPRPGATGEGTPSGARGGKANLTGRAGRGPARPAPTTGPEPALGGRRGGTGGTAVPPARSGRRAKEQPESWEYGDGDEELWLTESTAVGELEAPVEHRPRQQGRSLGQG